MPTPQREPLRRLSRAERVTLHRIASSTSERVDQVRRATALLAVACVWPAHRRLGGSFPVSVDAVPGGGSAVPPAGLATCPLVRCWVVRGAGWVPGLCAVAPCRLQVHWRSCAEPVSARHRRPIRTVPPL